MENWLQSQKICQKFTARKGGNGKYGPEPVAFVSVYGVKEGRNYLCYLMCSWEGLEHSRDL